MLEHGGQLRAAAAQYGIPLQHWLDLSTGINPVPYAPPPLPADAWSRLPQEDDGLEQAAAEYYGTPDLLPVAGSQAAIQTLPRLRERSRVGVLHPGYAEHAHAWRNAGHDVTLVAAENLEHALEKLSVLVLMNPNNPTGVTFAREELLAWHRSLAARGGWLVVDEAFIDATAQASVAQAGMPEGLIVLRSVGKFFGLAGARVGFALADTRLRAALRDALGPWAVSGPSRAVAAAALRDRAWQDAMRRRLARDSARLAQLLRKSGLPPAGGCDLFQWVVTEQAAELHRRLAQGGILTRYFDTPGSLRFGLPGRAAGWTRLEEALALEHAA